MRLLIMTSLVATACSLALAAAPAEAQHGPPAGVGGGPPAGVGGGFGGGPPAGVGGGPSSGVGGGFGGTPGSFPGEGNGAGHGPWGADGSFNQPGGQYGMSSGASTRVLDNTHVSQALGNALTHSGLTLPPGGLSEACSGFRRLGSCIAAMHVAHDLNLSGGFDALKTLMTTGDKLSLGKAIEQLSPNADAKAAKRAAKKQARADLRQAGNDLSG